MNSLLAERFKLLGACCEVDEHGCYLKVRVLATQAFLTNFRLVEDTTSPIRRDEFFDTPEYTYGKSGGFVRQREVDGAKTVRQIARKVDNQLSMPVYRVSDCSLPTDAAVAIVGYEFHRTYSPVLQAIAVNGATSFPYTVCLDTISSPIRYDVLSFRFRCPDWDAEYVSQWGDEVLY